MILCDENLTNIQCALSPSERRVVDCVLCGYKLSQIAEATSLKTDTVKSYMKRVYKKLDVHSKKELFEWFGRSLN